MVSVLLVQIEGVFKNSFAGLVMMASCDAEYFDWKISSDTAKYSTGHWCT
jgi:hypothetical protein